MSTQLDPRIRAVCTECGFSSDDIYLLRHHSCEVTKQGGQCEDYPCCGHERGDCNGLLYGSDESIKERVMKGVWVTYCGECETALAEGAVVCNKCGSEEIEYDKIDDDELDSMGYWD